MIKLKESIFIILFVLLALRSFSLGQSSRPTMGCGEQCIKLLCKFYDKQVPEDKILALLGPNEFGEATFSNLTKCIEKIGLDCHAFKGTLQDLTRIRYPVILHFKRKEEDKVGHFLVGLLDTKGNKLIGYDPALIGAPFDLTPETLSEFWTGAGLIVFPKQSHYKLWLLVVIIVGAFLSGSGIALIRHRDH